MSSPVAVGLRERGCFRIPGMFAPYVSELISLQNELPSPAYLGGVLADKAVLRNETLTAELSSLLGSTFVIARSHLGCGAAGVLATSRSRSFLFGDDATDSIAPLYSVTMFVPLEGTVVRCKETDLPLEVGDCLLIDSRAETAIVQNIAVSGLLMVFTRTWYRESNSSPSFASFELSLCDFSRLSHELQARVQWRFDRYLSQRPRIFLYQLANRLPFDLGTPLKRKLRRWASSY